MVIFSLKRNAEAEKFNSTHFNSNVVIYDIPVGKLTVKRATAKINEKAKNDAILEGDKVVLKKTGNKVITSKKFNHILKLNILATLAERNGIFKMMLY